MVLSTRGAQIQTAVAFVKASTVHKHPLSIPCAGRSKLKCRFKHIRFLPHAPPRISFNFLVCCELPKTRNCAIPRRTSCHFAFDHIATGKIHPLSSYTPVCHACGLPLCHLNLPYYPCPYQPCRTPLLSFTPDPFRVQLQPLIARIETEIKDQLKKQEDERALAAEELRLREGEFPMLKASPSPSPSPSPGSQPAQVRSGGGPISNHPHNQGYTVMSLTSGKGGKRSQITVASYRPGSISKSSSSSSLKKDAEDDGVIRIRCPTAQVEPVKPL